MAYPDPSDISRVACVGAGTIGAGWAAYFLARGLEVVASDPAPDAEATLAALVEAAWPKLERLGLGPGADRRRLRFEADPLAAVEGAQFVQESAPDREPLKIELFARLDAALPPEVVIASSTSHFLPSRLASACARPGRLIVGHPFAPSYLMPLVEVVGGAATDPAALDWAMRFYAAIGKHPVRLKQEIASFIANRLQRVIRDEINSLVEAGICDYEDADQAMAYGPGLRWAFAGPLLCAHLGGGRGGIRHMIDHFGWTGPPQLESVAVETAERLTEGQDMAALESWRDDNLIALLQSLRPLPQSGR